MPLKPTHGTVSQGHQNIMHCSVVQMVVSLIADSGVKMLISAQPTSYFIGDLSWNVV